jgi:hypothetical protein
LRRILLTLLGTSTVAIAVLAFAEARIADPDIWGLMAMGRQTLAEGWPPLRDPFSYVPTKIPLVYHEWLSGVAFYLLLTWLGSPALKGLAIALGVTTVALAAATARRLGASWLSVLVVLIMALPSMQHGYSPIRAQAITFFFFALFLFLLEEHEHGRRWPLLLIPAAAALWANLHGGFVAGIGLVVLYAVGYAPRRQMPGLLPGVCVAAALATLANPYGVRYWHYLYDALSMPRPFVTEWDPVPLDLTSRWAFKGLSVLAVLSVAVVRRRHWSGIIVMGVTAIVAMLHRRHVPFFAIAAIAFLPQHLSPLLDRLVASFRDRLAGRADLASGIGAVMLGSLTLAATFHLVRLDPWRLQVPALFYPVGAVEFIRLNGLHGNLATPFNWGEYVLWKLYPQVKVSFDGRYETVYPLGVTMDNFNFTYAQGDWRRLLREYPTDMVLVDRRSAAGNAMANEPGWSPVYADPISALFLRRGALGPRWRWPPRADGTIP